MKKGKAKQLADPCHKIVPNKKIRKAAEKIDVKITPPPKKSVSDDDETEKVFLLEDSQRQEAKKIQISSRGKPTPNFLKKNKLKIQSYQSDYKRLQQSMVMEKPKARTSRKYDHVQSKVGMNKMYSSFSQWGADSQSRVSQKYYLRIVDTSQISSIIQSERDILDFQISSGEEDKPQKLVKCKTTPQKMERDTLQTGIERIVESVRRKAINVIEEGELELGARVLGEGGFGVVRAGRWGQIGVAVKEVRVEQENWNKIESELVFLSTYRHPRMISLYGVKLQEIREGTGVGCSLVMELMDCDLDHLIWKQAGLDLQTQLRILVQVAEGLAFLHGKNLVHRDLKPKNILMRREGEELQVKLSDLGLSKLVEESTADNNTLSFTPRYTSREQAEGMVLTSGDIWSAGLICYELLARQRPWQGLSQVQIITQLIKGTSATQENWHSLLPPPVQDPLKHLVEQCLSYDPQSRPSAAQLFSCLSSILAIL